jgi:hypothetical protein
MMIKGILTCYTFKLLLIAYILQIILNLIFVIYYSQSKLLVFSRPITEEKTDTVK